MSNLANLMKARLVLMKEVRDAEKIVAACADKLSDLDRQIWEEHTDGGKRNAQRIPVRLVQGGPVTYLTPVKRERNGVAHFYLRGDEEKPRDEVLDLSDAE